MRIERSDSIEVGQDLDGLFQAHYARITKVIARITQDPSRAEELAVEVFLRWSARRDSGSVSDAGWLFRTAIHLALDEARRRSRRDRLGQFFQGLIKVANPEEILGSLDQRRMVVEVLKRLKPRDGEILLLRADGMSYEELGAALSLNAASVGKILSRAQIAFRKEYVRRYGKLA